MTDPQLSPVHQAVLVALADACNDSLSAHVPVKAVSKRVAPSLRGDVKKALEKLRSKWRYCQKHPTRGETTWELTRLGLDTARALREKLV